MKHVSTGEFAGFDTEDKLNAIYDMQLVQWEFLSGLSDTLQQMSVNPMLRSMLPMLAKTLPTLGA